MLVTTRIPATRYIAENARWLFWTENGWIELGVTRRKDAIGEESRFVNSISVAADKSIDLGKGAEFIFGDSDPFLSNEKETQRSLSFPLTIVNNAEAEFAHKALAGDAVGRGILRVKLNVTFLRNGGIGKVELLEGMKHGIAKHAIGVAKEMAFLPKRVDGKNVDVTQPVEFLFALYF